MSEFMYCPECRGEFRPEVAKCNTCDVPLVHRLPGEPALEYRDLVPVFAAVDLSELISVRNLLEAAGIPCFTQNEGIQEFFGVGRLTGFNPLIGSVQILVDRDLLEDAQQILQEPIQDADDA